ncbi:DUF3667 domain-containing protein [Robiginitomaculum antarcticum]|uniref:DUF3667 domain-containing protein n=1 Tax=Robiginitomaculum antarcticum TaxID=437507 RepID=UPI0003713514|nr:DUF3667 domain-containing protein [Robiginitomaculum antarcticum]
MPDDHLEEGVALAVLADSDLLSGDGVPDNNQSLNCFSCGAPIVGLYCKECGQKNDDLRRSIFGMGWEAFTSLFAFENRIWRTWLNLIIRPGKVAREYCNGRRTHWTSPVRVYIFMSIILFGFLSLTGRQIFSFEVSLTQLDTTQNKAAAELTADDYDMGFKAHFFEPRAAIERRNETLDFDIVREKVSGGFFNHGGDDEVDTPNLKIRTKDSGDRTITINSVNGEERIISANDMSDFITQIIRNPATLNTGLKTWLPRILFFMLPVAMLSGAVFIRGKDALLFDHLVHAAYIHGVMFLLIFVGIILSTTIPGNKIAQSILLILIFYLPISLKRMFGRGWIKTIIASYTTAILYLFVILILMIIIMMTIMSRNIGG